MRGFPAHAAISHFFSILLLRLFVCLFLMIFLTELVKTPFLGYNCKLVCPKSGVRISLNWETNLLQTNFNARWDQRHSNYHHYDNLTHPFGRTMVFTVSLVFCERACLKPVSVTHQAQLLIQQFFFLLSFR